MQTPIPQLIDLCKRYGLALGYKPFDGPTLMFALAMVESSEGKNCAPRHEDGYCRGGKYFDKIATEQWNCLAHMSYGEWQVMWANMKVAPQILLTDQETRAKLSSLFIANLALRASQAGQGLKASLALFAHHYNGPATTQKYIDDLTAAYQKGIPG
jgi:hypothetical protein